MAKAVVQIRYTGDEASCVITASKSGQTLAAAIGSLGAESADPSFGTAGTIDLTDSSVATLAQLVTLIDGYDDYTATVSIGEVTGNATLPEDASAQAKTATASIEFTVTSVLDTANALISWEYCQDMLGLDTADRLSYEGVINAASRAANRETGRKLKARTYTDYHYAGSGSEVFRFPEYPVNLISSFRVDAGRDFDADTEIDSDDYDLDADAGILYLLDMSIPKARRVVKTTYNAGLGYGTEPVDDDLRMAVLELVAWNQKRLAAGGNQLGIRNVRTGDGIITEMELSIPKHVLDVFRLYRRYE